MRSPRRRQDLTFSDEALRETTATAISAFHMHNAMFRAALLGRHGKWCDRGLVAHVHSDCPEMPREPHMTGSLK